MRAGSKNDSSHVEKSRNLKIIFLKSRLNDSLPYAMRDSSNHEPMNRSNRFITWLRLLKNKLYLGTY